MNTGKIVKYKIIICSELTKQMRQEDDLDYAKMMGRCRIGSPTDDDIRRLMKRFISVIKDPGK